MKRNKRPKRRVFAANSFSEAELVALRDLLALAWRGGSIPLLTVTSKPMQRVHRKVLTMLETIERKKSLNEEENHDDDTEAVDSQRAGAGRPSVSQLDPKRVRVRRTP